MINKIKYTAWLKVFFCCSKVKLSFILRFQGQITVLDYRAPETSLLQAM